MTRKYKPKGWSFQALLSEQEGISKLEQELSEAVYRALSTTVLLPISESRVPSELLYSGESVATRPKA